MWAGWAALQRKYAGLDCGVSLGLLARLHQACIPPVASYGCELWGLHDMPSRLAASRRKLCMGHVHMLRQISGLRKSTPPEMVFLETMGAPLSDSWLLRAVTFWNNLGSLPEMSLFKRVARDSISQALAGARNWASSFAQALVVLGHPFALSQDMPCVDPSVIRSLQLEHCNRRIFVSTIENLDPRTCPSQGVIACTYARLFQRPTWARVKVPFIHLSLPPEAHRLFLRFRAGCSGLPIDTGRHRGPVIPRAQRRCLRCPSQSVCDEFHMIFECPALVPLRVQFSALFTPATQTMLGFMWQSDSYAVAMFVAQALRFMAACPA